ncbi:MAG: hypothetical protein M3Z03_12590 [Actinomycetota bacterium]|nr:hypothetical protein [Actinomycetota bacterium]
MSVLASDLAAPRTASIDDALVTHPAAPIVDAAPGTPTVTVVIATQPGPHLRPYDRRRLTHRIRAADRRLRTTTTPAIRRQLRGRLAHLAAVAARLPVGGGLALVASTDDAALVHVRHPVRPRILIGGPPSRLDIAEAAAVPERLAILTLTLDRARLIVVDRGVLRDVIDDGLPVARRSPTDIDGLLPDYLEQIATAISRALPQQTPLVVAGDERLAAAFADRAPDSPVVAVLVGDHRVTSPLVLLGLARRQLHRSLTGPQRRALAEVAVALADGRLTVGLDGVRRGVTRARRPLLVLERGMRAQDPGTVGAAVAEVKERGGWVVVVPAGRLLEYGHIVLVHDATDIAVG